MIAYKALKGDPTDNIPGVPGVGEKTAAKLIREFGDLDSVFGSTSRRYAREATREKLRDHRDQVFMGRDLSTDRARPCR
jgi:DNA polymerase-1